MEPARPIWEQLPGEPLESFTRFQWYKTIGTSRGRRSVRAAYRTLLGLPKGAHPPEGWWADYRRYEWKRRAQSYDAALIAEVGERAAAKFNLLIDVVLDNAVRSASGRDGGPTAPKNYTEMMGFLRDFTQIVPPATLAALSARSRLLRDGGGGGGGEFLEEVPELPGPVHAGGAGGGPVGEAAGDSPAADDPAV